MMRSLVKQLAGQLGFEIHRKVPDLVVGGVRRTYPYVEPIKIKDIGFDFWVTDDTYRSWYDPAAQSKWCVNDGYLQLLKKGDKVLEVGCNAGFTTCLISKVVGDQGLVVGMDIIPSNCMVSGAQVGLNHLTNTVIKHVGAADFNGKVRINHGNNGSVSRAGQDDGGMEVDVIRCDELLKDYGHFDVLKVDVEGFESQVFKGATDLMSKRPRLLVEIHGSEVDKYGSTYEELFKLMRANEYEGLMYLNPNDPAATNQLVEFDVARLLRERVHANLFLRPRAS
jgi:FkbM family methyltransferase